MSIRFSVLTMMTYVKVHLEKTFSPLVTLLQTQACGVQHFTMNFTHN